MSEQLLSAVSVEHSLPATISVEAQDDFLLGKSYNTNTVWLRRIGNATVTADSVVYRNGWLIKESLPENIGKCYYRVRYPIKQWVKGNKIRLESGPFLLVTDIWSGGHFHWLGDVLPRLFCGREKISDFRLLLPDLPYLRHVAAASLQMLDISVREVIWMQPGFLYSTADLYLITHIAQSGRFHPSLMKAIREQFINGLVPGKKRIYISRSNAGYRKVQNEAEILPLLSHYGFDVYHAEDLSLNDQVKLFAGAEWLMGLHGAGLANACFMASGGLIELRRLEHGPHNVGYWHLADALGLKYYFLNGNPDSPASIVGRGCNIEVPVKELETLLKSIFSS